ncbi:MAG TPA: hypothetical protein VHT31_00165 [Candidatus Acidoferrum sp.]|nr:hypothetical protein [Candidatus Acidoferrum sp.]
MALSSQKQNARRKMALFAGAAGAALIGIFAAAARPDNPSPADSVGAIEGEAIAVTGPMSVQAVNGGIATVLHSGSDVRVKSGSARINLVEGGHIAVCGPAHFSVLKSGNSLTIALDTGTIHAHIERSPVLTIYTPQIQAQPVAIGGAAQDITVGFEPSGAMCVRTNRGALRLEQQLNGQNVLVPQGGSVFLANGQIDSLRTDTGQHCSCELQLADAAPPPPEISQLATAAEVHRKVEEVKPNVPAADPSKPVAPKEQPVYQVFVPPLIFNAKSTVQPEIDPRMIVLIRRVRVRPTLIFQGKVEGEAEPVKAAVAAPPAAPPPAPPPPVKTVTLAERVRNFFRKLWPFGS